MLSIGWHERQHHLISPLSQNLWWQSIADIGKRYCCMMNSGQQYLLSLIQNVNNSRILLAKSREPKHRLRAVPWWWNKLQNTLGKCQSLDCVSEQTHINGFRFRDIILDNGLITNKWMVQIDIVRGHINTKTSVTPEFHWNVSLAPKIMTW